LIIRVKPKKEPVENSNTRLDPFDWSFYDWILFDWFLFDWGCHNLRVFGNNG